LLSSFSIDQFSAAHPISLTGLRLLRINVMLILLHLEPESAPPTRRHLVRKDPELDSFVASGNLLTLAEGQTKGKEAAGKKAGERTLQ
jgi:hypothetical protein